MAILSMLEGLLNRTMLRVKDSLTEIQPPNFQRPRKYQANIGKRAVTRQVYHVSLQIIRPICDHLKLIDFHLLRWSAQQRLFTVLGALTSMLKTSAQLRLEKTAIIAAMQARA